MPLKQSTITVPRTAAIVKIMASIKGWTALQANTSDIVKNYSDEIMVLFKNRESLRGYFPDEIKEVFYEEQNIAASFIEKIACFFGCKKHISKDKLRIIRTIKNPIFELQELDEWELRRFQFKIHEVKFPLKNKGFWLYEERHCFSAIDEIKNHIKWLNDFLKEIQNADATVSNTTTLTIEDANCISETVDYILDY